MSGPRYFLPVFYRTLDVGDDDGETRLRRRIGRDWPWALEGEIVVSGLTASRPRVSRRGSLTTVTRFRERGPLAVNAALVYVSHLEQLVRLVRRGRVVVLAPSAEAAFANALLRPLLRRRLRLVVRVEGAASDKVDRTRGVPLEFRVKRAVERFSLRRCDLAVPMGGYTAGFARANGVPPERIELLPFPLAFTDQPPAPLPEEPTVLFAGRLEREKGVDVLLHAFARLAAELPAARLVIAGDGPQRHALEQLATTLGVRDRVELTGWLAGPDMAAMHRRAQVFCLPSVWAEGLGMVVVEAGLAARPVVASALGGIVDVVHDGDNGLTVPPRDPDALAAALRAVLTDRTRAEAMGRRGRERALDYLGGYDTALVAVQRRVAALFD